MFMFSKRYLKNLAMPLFILTILSIGVSTAAGQDSADIWKDSATGLIWAVKDNGSDVSWDQARNYCTQLSLGGYSDWSLPTIDELSAIFDKSVSKRYKAKGSIELEAASIWSETTNNAGDAWSLNFSYGGKSISPTRGGCGTAGRALCVQRSGK